MTNSFEFVGHEFDIAKAKIYFNYSLTLPDNQKISFTETLTLPQSNLDIKNIPTLLLSKVLDNLLLVLGLSYWKLYCPKKIKLPTIVLNPEQADFWNTLYTKGLGEFYYKNKIDFTGLVNFPSSSTNPKPITFPRKNRSLLPFGGGKDSIVSGELLKSAGLEFTPVILGTLQPTQGDSAKLLGIEPLVIGRELDPKLFELNQQPKTFNGHVPISAIYHFVGLLAAVLYDYKYLVFSNEDSANYGNVEYCDKQINHQWSKSSEFENLFQTYVSKFITPDVTAFSLLRPLSELKIAQIFTNYEQYFPIFSSCNTNFKQNISPNHNKEWTKSIRSLGEGWCGECPKCAFVFSMLAAFLPKEKVVSIFGEDLFNSSFLVETYKELLGTKNTKPFDCVGTPEETQTAFYLAYLKKEYGQDVGMQYFVQDVLPNLAHMEQTKNELLSEANPNLLPSDFKEVYSYIK